MTAIADGTAPLSVAPDSLSVDALAASPAARALAGVAQAGRSTVSPRRRRRLLGVWLPVLHRAQQRLLTERDAGALPLSASARRAVAWLERSLRVECRALARLATDLPSNAVVVRLWIVALERRHRIRVQTYRESGRRLRQELALADQVCAGLAADDASDLRRRLASIWLFDALPTHAMSFRRHAALARLSERAAAIELAPGPAGVGELLAVDAAHGARPRPVHGDTPIAGGLDVRITAAAFLDAIDRRFGGAPVESSRTLADRELVERLRLALDEAGVGTGRRGRARIATNARAFLHIGFRRAAARLGGETASVAGLGCRVIDRSGRGLRLTVAAARCGVFEVGDVAALDIDGRVAGAVLVEIVWLRAGDGTAVEAGARLLASTPLTLLPVSGQRSRGPVLLGRVGRADCDIFLPQGAYRPGECVGQAPRLGDVRSFARRAANDLFERHRARFAGAKSRRLAAAARVGGPTSSRHALIDDQSASSSV